MLAAKIDKKIQSYVRRARKMMARPRSEKQCSGTWWLWLAGSWSFLACSMVSSAFFLAPVPPSASPFFFFSLALVGFVTWVINRFRVQLIWGIDLRFRDLP